ncbi:MAG: DNA polymerase III subunit delta [Saprospiraceae bacterium]|nr:DNA polymerase III subunit delta [Saprospiraceae bacterium]
MSYQDILKELKQKKYRPIYFLHGAEAYFIDLISNYIEHEILTETEKAFNLTVLYGKEINHLAVVDSARRYPVMAERQVVIIKEAQEMKSLPDLFTYIEKPLDSTILVICHKHKTLNLNSKFGKLLKEKALVFDAKELYDNQVPDWIKDYLKDKGLKINANAANLIAEYLGTELSKIANELDKLALNLPSSTEINEKHIEENIGISKDYNVFELQKALGGRDVLKANRIVQYFADNPRKNPLPVVIGSLYNFFSKLYILHFVRNLPEKEMIEALQLRSAYFLKDYRAALLHFPLQKTEQVIGFLKEYDLKSKGVDFITTGKEDGELLKEMVWRILH